MFFRFGPVATPLPFSRWGWVSAHRLGSRRPTQERAPSWVAWSRGLDWGGREDPALFKPLSFGSLSPQPNVSPEECAAHAEAGDFRPRRTEGRAGARPAEAGPGVTLTPPPILFHLRSSL